MLAGLLFAMEEASAPPGRLVATLPFAGVSLIEHQARQLVAAGAAQIVVVAGAFDAELTGALHRIGRRGVAVDAVRTLGEAAATLHPLARVVMLADGLVAADATVAALGADGETGDALLALNGADAPAAFERIGGGGAWAGVARFAPQRLVEAAALPADYAPQSTLLHVIEAAGSARFVLTRDTLDDGHGVEREAGAIEQRGRRLVAAAVAARHGWFDRLIGAPIARLAMPALAGAEVSAIAALAIVALLGLIASAALILGWGRTGLVAAVVATLGCPIVTTLAMLRDERGALAGAGIAAMAVPAAAILLLGRAVAQTTGGGAPLIVALGVIIAGGLAIRAIQAIRDHRRWWGNPPGYLLVVTVVAIVGWPLAGLAMACCYAFVTLAAAIEALRGRRFA